MKKKLMMKIAICILGCAAIGYEHIYQLNELTAMRIEIPQIQQEIVYISEEIDRLNYEFQTIENPHHLLNLAKHAEYADLQFPLNDDIVVLQTEPHTQEMILAKQEKPFKMQTFKLSVILGAH